MGLASSSGHPIRGIRLRIECFCTWKGVRENRMPPFSETFIFWIVLVTQLAGIASVVVARLSERSCGAALGQRTFFVCLIAVGLTTVLAIWLQAGSWLSGATTLGLMALGATFDCRVDTRSATGSQTIV
jgi:hypothetical protein